MGNPTMTPKVCNWNRAPQGCFEKNVVLCWFLQHEVDMKPWNQVLTSCKNPCKNHATVSVGVDLPALLGTSGTHHTSTHFPKCQPSGQRAKGTKPIASDSPVSCCMVFLPHPFSTTKLWAGWLCTNANFGFLTFTSSPEMTERHSFHTDPSNTNVRRLWYRVSHTISKTELDQSCRSKFQKTTFNIV